MYKYRSTHEEDLYEIYIHLHICMRACIVWTPRSCKYTYTANRTVPKAHKSHVCMHVCGALSVNIFNRNAAHHLFATLQRRQYNRDHCFISLRCSFHLSFLNLAPSFGFYFFRCSFFVFSLLFLAVKLMRLRVMALIRAHICTNNWRLQYGQGCWFAVSRRHPNTWVSKVTRMDKRKAA